MTWQLSELFLGIMMTSRSSSLTIVTNSSILIPSSGYRASRCASIIMRYLLFDDCDQEEDRLRYSDKTFPLLDLPV